MANPATRLHGILVRGQEISPRTEAIAAWARIFDLPSSELRLVLPPFMEACSLPNRILQAFAVNGENNVEPYTRHFDPLHQLLSANSLAGQWGPRRQLITDQVLYCVEMAGHALDKYPNENEVSEETIKELFNKIRELRDLVGNSGMPEDLFHFMADSLFALEKALVQYHVLGADALLDATYPIIGEIIVRKSDLVGAGDPPSQVSGLMNLLTDFNTVASAAKNVKALSAPFGALLLELCGN